MPSISVIIPVYNVEEVLEECLKSVINQTFYDIEIICINDGSTDNSRDILLKYKELDHRIIFIDHDKNSGLSHARNCGIEKSNGEYLMFLDSDDMLVVTALESLYTFSRKNDLEIASFDTEVLYETEKVRAIFNGMNFERKSNYTGIYTGPDLFAEQVHNKDWWPMVWLLFINREFLMKNNVRFYEGILHEDYIFTFQLIMNAEKVSYLNEKYYFYRRRENSITAKPVTFLKIESLFISYIEMLDIWKHAEYNTSVNDAIDIYLKNLYGTIKYYYNNINQEEVSFDIIKKSIYYQHLFRNIVNKNRLCKLSTDKINLIRKYKKVIIYGAGKTAREILEILDENEIGLYGFAVSSKDKNPDYIMWSKVSLIDDLKKYNKTALVIVGVTNKYKDHIVQRLKELEFTDIMCVL